MNKEEKKHKCSLHFQSWKNVLKYRKTYSNFNTTFLLYIVGFLRGSSQILDKQFICQPISVKFAQCM